MSDAAVKELHGHERLVFPGFDDETNYLERATVTRHREAVRLLRDQGSDWGGCEPKLQRIWMRYGKPETDAQSESLRIYGDGETAWWECNKTDPGATPFWKDAP